MTDAVFVEDEPVLRGELEDSLPRLWPGLRVAAKAEDGVEVLDALGRCKPRELFRDIEMPGLSGPGVARAASGRCRIVFVTAYSRRAVATSEQGMVECVMKPFSAARRSAAIRRVSEQLDAARAKLDGQFELRLKQCKVALAVSEPFAFRFRPMRGRR